MTNEAEQAKEKVLAVHPCAFLSAKGTVWSERGAAKVRLGKSWLDAASRLPARLEAAKPMQRPSEESVCKNCRKVIWRCTDGEGLRFDWKHRDEMPSFYCNYPKTHAEPVAPSPVPSAKDLYTYQVLYEKRAKELAGLIVSGHVPSIDKVARLLAKEDAGR